MKNNKHTAHTPEELLSELKGLVLEAEGMMVDSVTEHSAAALDNLRERFGAAQERFSVVCDDTKKRVVAGAKYTDTSIRENPYQALLIAAGVGVLVGALLGRRIS